MCGGEDRRGREEGRTGGRKGEKDGGRRGRKQEKAKKSNSDLVYSMSHAALHTQRRCVQRA